MFLGMSVFIQILIYRGGWFLFFICVRRIFCLNYVIYFLCSFLSSFFPKKEERKGTKERRKKRVQTYHENPRVTHSVRSDLGMFEICLCEHSVKMLVKHSHFRDVLSVLRSI